MVRSPLSVFPLLTLLACEDIRVTLLDSAASVSDTAAPDTAGDTAADTATIADTGDSGGDSAIDSAGDTGPAPPAWALSEPSRLLNRGALGAAWLSSADLDHDGFVDLVYLDVNSGGTADRLTIWHGSAAGLGPAAESTVATLLSGCVLGDLDGDGFVDLLARASEGVGWFPGDGEAFGAFQVLGGVEAAPLLGAMDLTGDGADELVAWVWERNAYLLRVWSSHGGVAPRVYAEVEEETPGDVRAMFPYTPPGSPRAVAVLAEVRLDPTSTPYLALDPSASSPASLGAIGLIRAATDDPSAGFSADLDGDGLAEIVTNGTLGLVTWNPATGTRSAARKNDPASQGSLGLAAGDLDGDGVTDAVELLSHYVSTDHSSSSTLQLQPSLTAGGDLSPLAAAEFDQGPPTIGQFRQVLAVADFSGDGCVDAAYLDISLEPWLAKGVCPVSAP